jgi:hypothetical protein
VEVTHPGKGAQVEHQSGRMMDAMVGQKIIGALGVRHATSELTGSWKKDAPNNELTFLTGAGVLGTVTSISPYCPQPIRAQYLGHISIDGEIRSMHDYQIRVPHKDLNIPVILVIGTSMASGKTSAAKIIVHLLKEKGLTVGGIKLTGAGRYRDILAMKDAGAKYILDFVDAGLPSSICSPIEYKAAMNYLVKRIANFPIDIAVVEIGASPFEPYNGAIAMEEMNNFTKFLILCSSDPYAVLGMTKELNVHPNLVCGPVVNTQAGIDLLNKYTDVKSMNLRDEKNLRVLWRMLKESLGGQLV